MKQALVCVTCLAAAACSTPEPLGRAEAFARLKEQAEEVARAGVSEDHARMADLTHPALVKKLGGRERFIERLELIASEMKTSGFQLRDFSCGEPSDIVESSGGLYATLPSKLTSSGPGGVSGTKHSYLVAASEDGGRTWRFLDGAGVGDDRTLLKKLLPDFPDNLPLPANRPAESE